MVPMERWRTATLSWIFSLGLAGLPFCLVYSARWAPVLLLLLLPLFRTARNSRIFEPFRSILICVAGIVAVTISRGWEAGLLSLLGALAVGITAWLGEGWPGGRRPDTSDYLLALLIALDVTAHSEILGTLGWIPLLIVGLSCRRLFRILLGTRKETGLRPPSREIRGTVSFSGTLLGPDGLPRSSALDLELRAGTSVAILCDSSSEAAALGEHLAARARSPKAQLCYDGEPVKAEDLLSAFIGMGEEFVPGGIDENLAVLLDEDLSQGARAGIWQACALDEVAQELDGASIQTDGSPLSHFHRLLVEAARIIPSTYRILIAVDPMHWVNPVHGGLWRAALIRACLGRTSIVLTADRELAECMDRIMFFRHGRLSEATSGKGE